MYSIFNFLDRCTIVQEQRIFWTGLESIQTLTFATRDEPTGPTPPEPTESSSSDESEEETGNIFGITKIYFSNNLISNQVG